VIEERGKSVRNLLTRESQQVSLLPLPRQFVRSRPQTVRETKSVLQPRSRMNSPHNSLLWGSFMGPLLSSQLPPHQEVCFANHTM
jgi:hypothetical protein